MPQIIFFSKQDIIKQHPGSKPRQVPPTNHLHDHHNHHHAPSLRRILLLLRGRRRTSQEPANCHHNQYHDNNDHTPSSHVLQSPATPEQSIAVHRQAGHQVRHRVPVRATSRGCGGDRTAVVLYEEVHHQQYHVARRERR